MAKKQAGNRPGRYPSRAEPIFARDGAHICPRPSRSPAGIAPVRKHCRNNIDITLIHMGYTQAFRATGRPAEEKISGLPSPLIRRPSGLYP